MAKEYDQDDVDKRGANVGKYRHSRSIVQGAAVDETRRGDLIGAKRGVFHAGLAACALGADSAEEAMPFLIRLAHESGDPGWVLAAAGLEADSAPFIQALVESKLLALDELVWTGFRRQSGEPCRDFNCLRQAVRLGAHRCLKYLVEIAPSDGLLAQASAEAHPKTFELLLDRASKLGRDAEINQAFAALADRPNRRLDSDLLGAHELGQALLKAGAKLGHRSGAPLDWSSWNGALVSEIDFAWVPALRLCEPGDALPESASREGSMQGAAFFSQWSSACLYARAAIEGGADEQGWRSLREIQDWELARAEGSWLSPIALMAMTDSATTDSKLRRTILDTTPIIAKSRHLDAALEDGGPLSLAKCAIASWLWRPLARPPVPGDKKHYLREGMEAPDLITELSLACERMEIRPLGPVGSMAAAQEFSGRMLYFGDGIYQKIYAPTNETASAGKDRRDLEQLRLENRVAVEFLAAQRLSIFMEQSSASLFLEAVEQVHRRGRIDDPQERSASKERLALALTPSAPSSGRHAMRV